MTAKELYNGAEFTYGRHRKPITIKKIIPVADTCGAYGTGKRIYIVPEKGKHFFLSADTLVFLYQPFETITNDKTTTFSGAH
jgi:hypothetical protein